jgi:hypothetical protein
VSSSSRLGPSSAPSRSRSSRRRRGLTTSRAPTAAELLAQGTGWLTRPHLRDLGLTRTAIDGVFRELDPTFFPGVARGGCVKVEDFLELAERCTYRDDRVRPT